MTEPDAEKTTPTPAPKKRRWLRRLGLCALGILGACLLLELLVSLLFGTQVRFPRHVVSAPWGIRYNEPGASYWHTSPDVSVHFRINAQGMRGDRDVPYEKPADVRRIVCLGDSFTAGYEVDESECFARRLEAGLLAQGVQCEVLNAGVSGFSTAEAVVYLERELLKYDPDVVVLSFYFNDVVDNLRTNLFVLDGDRLVVKNRDYVPLGGVGDFVNRNWLTSFLSEHSNAFALLKEQITRWLKKDTIAQHQENLNGGGGDGTGSDESDYQARLCAAILERLYTVCGSHDLPLVIQNIPAIAGGERLVDVFPRELFDVTRPAIEFIDCRDFLAPHLGKELLYHQRSHSHWTPFAHALAAERLVDAVQKFLGD